MKQCYYILFLFFICSCEQKNNHEQKKQLIPHTKKTKLIIDTLKPPLIIKADEPSVICVPSAPGSFFINHSTTGNKKIDLLPPVSQILPEGFEHGTANFINYTTEQGLSMDAIYCSLKDKNGNLWFGINGGGVSKYDGKIFKNYLPEQGLAHSIVLCMLEDKKGNLWFGTDGGGVSKYDGNSFTNYTVLDGLASNAIQRMFEDEKGDIWFGNNDQGKFKYKNSLAKQNTTDVDIKQIKKGVINQKSKLTKSYMDFEILKDIGIDNAKVIVKDRKGNIWFSRIDAGVSKYDVSRSNHPCNKNKCKHNLKNPKDLEQHNKEIAKTITNFTTIQGLVSNNILCILEDKTGNIWFGQGNGGGVSKYDISRENHPCIKNNCKHNLNLLEDLKVHNAEIAKSFTCFNNALQVSGKDVSCIVEDNSGNLWFGTSLNGIYCYYGKSLVNFTYENGLQSDMVYSIVSDKLGNIWFGNQQVGGLARYDGKSIINYRINRLKCKFLNINWFSFNHPLN